MSPGIDLDSIRLPVYSLSMLAVSFWMLVLLVAFVYVGYPLTLRILPRRPIASRADDVALPTVSILIAAHNEEAVLETTLENKLSLDYPPDSLQVIVVSDGSIDRTDAIARQFRERGVKFFRQEPRQGKTMALNLAVEHATGEILVFSDANSVYKPDALRHLVRPFTDTNVGYVTGSLRYVTAGEDGKSAVSDNIGAYMRYENWLRRLESRVGSIIGVNGGIDAVRRPLYVKMRADHLPDFYLPLTVIERGRRVVYQPDAVLYEHSLEEVGDELRMRIRVSLRAFRTLWELRRLMNPLRGLVAYEIFFHKLLRYGVGWLMLLAFVLNALLLPRPLYLFTLSLQAAFYVLAATGPAMARLSGISSLTAPYYFVLINYAAGIAFVKFLSGHKQVVWNPRKGA